MVHGEDSIAALKYGPVSSSERVFAYAPQRRQSLKARPPLFGYLKTVLLNCFSFSPYTFNLRFLRVRVDAHAAQCAPFSLTLANRATFDLERTRAAVRGPVTTCVVIQQSASSTSFVLRKEIEIKSLKCDGDSRT
ncbi:hypothetical protein EVAR_17755_1 [Eumeta japonica]|uniref:Uncharacterized protein n=1 Tax=Eumeta variegata TaxID=151549 RepID=A0A4C1TTB6_EUMVA|nr:hypothetical protein EVAR_17755_1 [Eumeta japonica]